MQFTRRLISTAPDIPWDLVPTDLDNDGDMDVIVGANMDGKLFWIEQTQTGFVDHEIQRNGVSPGIRTVFAIDMEHDGDVDIVVGDVAGRVAWLENDGNQNFNEHEVATDDWVEVVVAVDIDDDGMGFPESNPNELLKRGMRADSKTDGQGIGLAVSADIIRKAGGDIELMMSPQVGARVRLLLPV